MIPAGGLVGSVLADALVASMNLTGAILTVAACWIVSLYLVSQFEMAHLLGLVPAARGVDRRTSVRAFPRLARGARTRGPDCAPRRAP